MKFTSMLATCSGIALMMVLPAIAETEAPTCEAVAKDKTIIGETVTFYGTFLSLSGTAERTATGVVRHTWMTYTCRSKETSPASGVQISFDEADENTKHTPAASKANGETTVFRMTGVVDQVGSTITLKKTQVALPSEPREEAPKKP